MGLTNLTMTREVIIDRIDLVVLYCIVHSKSQATEEAFLSHPNLSASEVERMVEPPGIARIWGNKVYLTDGAGRILKHDGKPIPGGLVNRFIVDHRLGAPLMHPAQFYRISDKLVEAGWLIGGKHYKFTHRDAAVNFVNKVLDRIPNPHDWPTYVPVANGWIADPYRISPRLPKDILRAII